MTDVPENQPEMGTPEFMEMCIKTREKEVLGYQFNIENYRLAIQHIEADADLKVRQAEFLNQLKNLLASELLQQERAHIMLDVLRQRSKVKEAA